MKELLDIVCAFIIIGLCCRFSNEAEIQELLWKYWGKILGK